MSLRKIIQTVSVLMIVLFISDCRVLIAQKDKIPVKDKKVRFEKATGSLSQTPEIVYSERQSEIAERMNTIKNSEILFPQGEILTELQREIESLNGSTFTETNHEPFGYLVPFEKLNGRQTDDLTSNQIQNPYNVPVAKAFQVEQRGATAGKQWLAIGYANGDTGILAKPDTLAVYYSTDQGLSFTLFAMIAFSSHNKFTLDDMDMEIIENTTGEKYIHIVFGYQTNGGYGQKLIGYTVLRTPTLGYAGTTIFPPGYNSTSQYFQARITSDNARYLSNPYLTIVMSQDSIANSQSHIMTKMCRVLSPYTTSPVLTYLPKSIYNQVPGFNGYEVMTDVANYHNGNDSLIFVLSNYPGFESTLYFYKAYSNLVQYPVSSGGFNLTGDNLEYARIASSGGTNQTQMMITYSDNYLNSGDFDQFILKSENAVSWTGFSIDYTSYNNSRYGDIIGKRNVNGSFNIAYKNIYNYVENVGFASISNNVFTKNIFNVNTNFASSYCSPKPGFRNVQNDSCQTIWSDFYRTYSTTGCEASYIIVKAALEGYLDENTDEHSQYLPVNVFLAEQSPPYNIIDTGLAYLDYQRLSNVFTFPNAPTGNFYLVIKTFNTIETWSSSTIYVDPFFVSGYNFTDFQNKAYGDNQKFKGTNWCIYSGDINQDGVIDLDDMLVIDNDAYNFVTQMSYVSDLNGDNFVDIADIVIGDNNAMNFVSTVKP